MKALNELSNEELQVVKSMLWALGDEPRAHLKATLEAGVALVMDTKEPIDWGRLQINLSAESTRRKLMYDPNELLLYIKGFGTWNCLQGANDMTKEKFIFLMGKIYDQMKGEEAKQVLVAEGGV